LGGSPKTAQQLLAEDGLVGLLRLDRWNGRETPQFQIEDAAPVCAAESP